MNMPRIIAHLPRIILIVLIFVGAPLLVLFVLSASDLLPSARPEPTPTPTPILSGVAEPSNWKYQTGESTQGDFYISASITSTSYVTNIVNDEKPAELFITCFPDSQQTILYIEYKVPVSTGSENLEVDYTFDRQPTVLRSWSTGYNLTSAIVPTDVKSSFAYLAMHSHTLRVETNSWAGLQTKHSFQLRGKSNPWHPVLLVLEACGEA